MVSDPLRLPASPERLALLRDRAGLSPAAHDAAVQVLFAPPEPSAWQNLLDRGSLLVGWGLVVAGVLYGIAWNWGELGYLTRLVGIGVVLAVTALIAVWRSPTTTAGAAASTASLLLVGGLLAQLGISYQTGADAWELFAAWTLLGLPFAAATRGGWTWLTWILLPDLTLGLVIDQRDLADGDDKLAALVLGIGALHLALWAALRLSHRIGWPEGKNTTPGRLAVLLALLLLSLGISEQAWQLQVDSTLQGVAAVAWLGAVVGLLAGVRVGADPLLAAGAALGWLYVSSLPLFRLWFRAGDMDPLRLGSFGLIIVAEAAVLTSWIRRHLPDEERT